MTSAAVSWFTRMGQIGPKRMGTDWNWLTKIPNRLRGVSKWVSIRVVGRAWQDTAGLGRYLPTYLHIPALFTCWTHLIILHNLTVTKWVWWLVHPLAFWKSRNLVWKRKYTFQQPADSTSSNFVYGLNLFKEVTQIQSYLFTCVASV